MVRGGARIWRRSNSSTRSSWARASARSARAAAVVAVGELDEAIGHEWAGDSWVVLFSHPADYTPVCTTELGEVSRLRSEWEKRNVKTIALSVDSAESHGGWICDINETQNTTVDYPILAVADEGDAQLGVTVAAQLIEGAEEVDDGICNLDLCHA
mgnify:CR=1 FL=1